MLRVHNKHQYQVRLVDGRQFWRQIVSDVSITGAGNLRSSSG